MIEKSSVIAMSDDAGPFFITHTKSHNMKALVIPSHSWSPLLPLSCFYEQKWTFLGLCKAIWSIFGGGGSTWQGLSEHTGDSDNSHSFQNHSDNTNGINIDFLEGTVTVKANDRKWMLTDTHFHTIHWWFCQGHAWLCNTARHFTIIQEYHIHLNTHNLYNTNYMSATEETEIHRKRKKVHDRVVFFFEKT